MMNIVAKAIGNSVKIAIPVFPPLNSAIAETPSVSVARIAPINLVLDGTRSTPAKNWKTPEPEMGKEL